MPPSDQRSPRKIAGLWGIVAGIAVMVCIIAFVRRPAGIHQPRGRGGTDGEGKPVASGLEALELVRSVEISGFGTFAGYEPHDAMGSSGTAVHFIGTTTTLVWSRLVPVGANISGTKFKVQSFEHKEVIGGDGATKDVSEVTVVNKETGERVVAPLHSELYFRTPYAVFNYRAMGQPTPDFEKRLGETFSLPPEHDTIYKVIAIKNREVVIEAPDRTTHTLRIAPPNPNSARRLNTLPPSSALRHSRAR